MSSSPHCIGGRGLKKIGRDNSKKDVTDLDGETCDISAGRDSRGVACMVTVKRSRDGILGVVGARRDRCRIA